MSDRIYNFAKVEKKFTAAGYISLAIGVVSIVILALFMIAGIYTGGRVTGAVCVIPYLTLAASIAGCRMALNARNRSDISGKYIQSGLRASEISLCLHLLIFLIGLLEVIM